MACEHDESLGLLANNGVVVLRVVEQRSRARSGSSSFDERPEVHFMHFPDVPENRVHEKCFRQKLVGSALGDDWRSLRVGIHAIGDRRTSRTTAIV